MFREIKSIPIPINLQILSTAASSNNIQFTIIDELDPDAGIGLFSSNTFDYTVTEGDEVVVRGAISQFNGLTQITPDTVILVSSGNDLHAA